MARAKQRIAPLPTKKAIHLGIQLPVGIQQLAADRTFRPRFERCSRLYLEPRESGPKNAIRWNDTLRWWIDFGINATVRHGETIGDRQCCGAYLGVAALCPKNRAHDDYGMLRSERDDRGDWNVPKNVHANATQEDVVMDCSDALKGNSFVIRLLEAFFTGEFFILT